jgi:hypothetical protein
VKPEPILSVLEAVGAGQDTQWAVEPGEEKKVAAMRWADLPSKEYHQLSARVIFS